jgi:hypothetical protein
MDYEILKTILCLLEKIKYKADLTPQPTEEEIKEKKKRKEELEKKLKEIKERVEKNRDIATQALGVITLPLLSNQINTLKFELLEGKKIFLTQEDITRCGINFEDDFKNLLKKIKKDYGIIIDFREVIGDKQKYYEIALPKDFDKRYAKILQKLRKLLSKVAPKESEKKEKEKGKEKKSLRDMPISYDAESCVIKIGELEVKLPPGRYESDFCKIMFKYEPNKPISWDVIWEEITGSSLIRKKPEPTRENWQMVYDTMRRINKRVKQALNVDENLFSWKEKQVIRNF